MELKHIDGKDVVFQLSGRMTARDNELFHAVLNELKKGGGRTVALDLSGLEYIDSFGIGLFLVAVDDAKKHGSHLEFRNPHGAVKRVFELTDLDAVLNERSSLPQVEHTTRGGLSLSPLREGEHGAAVVALAGRLTFTDHELFERTIRTVATGTYRRVDVDLTRLEFMDSAGLSMLLIMRDELARKGGQMRLLSPNGRVAQLLRLASIDTLVHVDGQN